MTDSVRGNPVVVEHGGSSLASRQRKELIDAGVFDELSRMIRKYHEATEIQ